jgi:shikimate kinase/3-dehydroquinate synthase
VSHVASLGLPAELRTLNRRFSAATLVRHMRRDKKMQDGALKFVLVQGIGQAFTSANVEEQTVIDLLRQEGCDA